MQSCLEEQGIPLERQELLSHRDEGEIDGPGGDRHEAWRDAQHQRGGGDLARAAEPDEVPIGAPEPEQRRSEAISIAPSGRAKPGEKSVDRRNAPSSEETENLVTQRQEGDEVDAAEGAEKNPTDQATRGRGSRPAEQEAINAAGRRSMPGNDPIDLPCEPQDDWRPRDPREEPHARRVRQDAENSVRSLVATAVAFEKLDRTSSRSPRYGHPAQHPTVLKRSVPNSVSGPRAPALDPAPAERAVAVIDHKRTHLDTSRHPGGPGENARSSERRADTY